MSNSEINHSIELEEEKNNNHLNKENDYNSESENEKSSHQSINNSNDSNLIINTSTKIQSHKSNLKKLGKRKKKPLRNTKNLNINNISNVQNPNQQILKNIKAHFIYLPFTPLPDLSPYLGELIEIRISTEFLSQLNKAFIDRRIWGSDIYTSDSDAVCILQHTGFFRIKDLPPSDIKGVSLILRVSRNRCTYNSSLKNGIKSKKLNNYYGHSIKPENYKILNNFGDINELKEMASQMPNSSEYEKKKPISIKLLDNNYYTEFNMIFNLSYEMWLAYSLPAICDKGYECKEYTSYKLKDKVLYFENKEKRYEISLILENNNDDFLFEPYEKFNFNEVLSPEEKDNDFMLDNKVPLENKYVKEIFKRLDWQDFIWGENSIKVKDMIIEGIKCFNYYNIKNK